MEIIKLYTHEKGEEKDGFRLKLASNKQFNNLSQPSLAADRELDDLKRGLRSVSAQRFSENTKLSRKQMQIMTLGLPRQQWRLIIQTLKEGYMMRHWPLRRWETRPLAARCRHLLQQDDCSNNWKGIQAVMNAKKATCIFGKCRISREQIQIITFGSPRRQAGDLQCNAEKRNVEWDISHWREEIEAAQLQTQELTSDDLDKVDNSWNRWSG